LAKMLASGQWVGLRLLKCKKLVVCLEAHR
jgi:hypothetical protein